MNKISARHFMVLVQMNLDDPELTDEDFRLFVREMLRGTENQTYQDIAIEFKEVMTG